MIAQRSRIRGIALAGFLTLSVLSNGCTKKNVKSTELLPDFAVSCIAVAPAASNEPLDSELLSKIERKELEDGLYFLNKFLKKHFLSRRDLLWYVLRSMLTSSVVMLCWKPRCTVIKNELAAR
ncbi:MAG: hypothetical protein D3910_07545 [Candidatus Electrothrix sp. ATG2]|nr:hypothetical protein [Candidatus Electrothrix sp. ATG2]